MRNCIVCLRSNVEMFLDLGETTLANKFLRKDELDQPEPSFPLRVGFCHDCGHVQLMDHVPPQQMFSDYLYVSGVSQTLKDHLYDLSDVLVDRFKPAPDDLVLDIGCNDGTLLNGFRRHGVRTLGVDPAVNLAALADGRGTERYVGFFDSTSAREIVSRWGRASIVTATNSFPHIPELHDFMQGINTVLAPGGVFVVEAHYLTDLLDQVAFDTIYHEHVSYWSLKATLALVEQFDFAVTNVERLPLHHGQLRVSIQRRSEAIVMPTVSALLADEHVRQIHRIETLRRFAQRTAEIKHSLLNTLHQLRSQGNRLVAYGAPAKGNTLLSYLDLTPDLIEYIADRSSLKQGRFTPGTHIPVVSPARLLADQPDFVLLLAWNFVDEIVAQQAEYCRRGGAFILPVPSVRIIRGQNAWGPLAKAS